VVVERPRVLIEDWLPVAELGIESRRESAPIPGQFPKLKTLHVWWARRPLAASAGVVLASVMPAWSENLAALFESEPDLKSYATYRQWFLRLCGILGDPVTAKRLADQNKAAGIRTTGNPYSYKPAFKNSPSTKDLSLLHRLLVSCWGRLPEVIDPTAGGGSIPFEAVRYGLPSVANDLNPVSVAVLRAGLELPVTFSGTLRPELEKWGTVLSDRVRRRLEPFFPGLVGEQPTNYVFARTVACPRTGKQVPLSPNWWLCREAGSEAAIRLVTERGREILESVEFEIARGDQAHSANPDRGTVSNGVGLSSWDELAIHNDYIKAEAQAGRMGSQLCAVVTRVAGSREFRAPTITDLDALAAAEQELKRLRAGWMRENILPAEEFPPPIPKHDIRPYGFLTWRDFFSPRQQLVHGTFVEEFRRLAPELRDSVHDGERADAILRLLGLMVSKAVDWDSVLTIWDVSRQKVGHTFTRHDFAFKWSFVEFEGARELYPWTLKQLLDAYSSLAALLEPGDAQSIDEVPLDYAVPGSIRITNTNAGDMSGVRDGSQLLVCIDPPYGDNVMYAELSDFFYVWEKRTLGHLWPEEFSGELTDKKNEAVANVALFSDLGRRKKELAAADYEAKMQAIFGECHRVLSDAGVMTVMFTHKSADAWDALGMALMEAGFTIEASWPVNTESEQSLHQAKKNAAASTIMLVCRKRVTGEGGDFFEDVEPLVRTEARRALEAFSAQGIGGVDLLLATYGPALSVISSRWPVYSSEADPVTGRSRLLRPEEALDAARAEVTRLQRNRLVGREQSLDPISDFVLVAWDTFRAVEFPFDEARRLALAIGGLDIEELRAARVLEKKSGTVVLLSPAKRVRRDADLEGGLPGVYPEATGFTIALDGVHTAIYIADVDGLAAAKAFLDRAGLTSDPRFMATLQGLVNAIPRTKIKGEWVVPEAGTLDRVSAAYFPDVELPQEPERPVFEQSTLLGEE
jgi:putative DNA methylase